MPLLDDMSKIIIIVKGKTKQTKSPRTWRGGGGEEGNKRCNLEDQTLKVLIEIVLLFASRYLHNGLKFSVLLQKLK